MVIGSPVEWDREDRQQTWASKIFKTEGGLRLPTLELPPPRQSPPAFFRSTLPSPDSVGSSMPSEPPRTLPITVRSCLLSLSPSFFFLVFVVAFKICSLIGCFFRSHNSRQRILQLVKETSAKLKSLSESDQATNVNVSSPCSPFCLFALQYQSFPPFFFLFLNFKKRGKILQLLVAVCFLNYEDWCPPSGYGPESITGSGFIVNPKL